MNSNKFTIRFKTGNKVSISSGRSYGITGTNGVGKSTLLRCLATIQKIKGLQIIVDGFDLSQTFNFLKLSEFRSRIQYSQGAPYGLYPRLTGSENLQFFAGLQGVNLDSRTAHRMMSKVGLNSQKVVATYSLGMKQRLHIARIISTPAQLVLVDEPTNGLDPEGVALVSEIFRTELKQATKVIVSHDHQFLKQVTDERIDVLPGWVV